MGPDVVTQFYTDVEPIITPLCGGCHSVLGTNAPSFMMKTPDMLQNMLAYPGIIGSSPQTSRLYMKGVHEGPAFTPDQLTVVGNWITFYNSNKPMGDGGMAAPTVIPFAPSTTESNTIDLSALDPTLAGVTVTFNAQFDEAAKVLTLTSLDLVTPASTGVHVTHPVFFSWDQNLMPTPDPADSFSNLDETVMAGSTAPLGPGTFVLSGFAMGDLISVAFSKIEATSGSTNDGGTTVGCKALSMFVSTVKPLFSANGCSAACHVGSTPQAGVKWDTTPDDALCLVALSEINPTSPAQSPLLLQPDPAQNNGHPQKVNPFTNFQTAVTNWINAEK